MSTRSNHETAGPLTRLLRGLGVDDFLPPIQVPKRITETPVTVGIPVSALTPDSLVCPTCKLFEIPVDMALCPRCTRIAENLARKAAKRSRHHELVEREVLARKLDAIDPDWPSKFLTTDAAARFYREELSK